MANEKLSRGNVRMGLIACCIFYACKKHNAPRSIKEISCMCEIEPTVFNSAHKVFREIMTGYIGEEYFEETTQVDNLVSRFCTYLNMNRKQSFYISKIVKNMNEKIDESQILIGKTPSAITAACIYYVMINEKMEITKKNLSVKLNVSVVTINKIYQVIMDNRSMFE